MKPASQKSPDQYCAEQVNRSRSSFKLSFLLLSKERQQAINALYTFCREVDDIVDETEDSTSAGEQLEQWRSEINALYAGSPTHPISYALQPAIEKYALPSEHFMAIIDGMAMDLGQSRYATFDDLYLYCYRAAGAVGLLAAKIFGYQNSQTEEYAEALGIALQLTNILRDVGEDLARGRIYIPQDELARFGLTESTLTNATLADSTKQNNLIELLQFQHQRADEYYHKALSSLPAIDRKAQLSGLVMGAIYHDLLKEIRRAGYPVLNRKVRLSTSRKIFATLKYLLMRRYV